MITTGSTTKTNCCHSSVPQQMALSRLRYGIVGRETSSLVRYGIMGIFINISGKGRDYGIFGNFVEREKD